METFHSISDFRKWRKSLPDIRAPFVPTMGALHEGHISLVAEARRIAGPTGKVLASIFVNPTQFGPSEDFSKYPRTLEADLAMLNAAGCDAVFVPSAQEMYPSAVPGARTAVVPGEVAAPLEGVMRPGHFQGVCTVVMKLLHIVEPSDLLLGQKDFQQQAVLRRMCVDLDLPVNVLTCPTVREADGLAMSSRNRYLSVEERPRAAEIYQALQEAKQAYDGGERRAAALETRMRSRLEARGLAVQYAVAVRSDTLTPWPDGAIASPAVLLIAAKLGATRLIDNLLLSHG